MPLRDSIYNSLSRRLFDNLFLFNLAAMLVGMVLSRFTGVVGRLEPVPVGDMGMVRRFLVVAGFMVHGSFAMMSCRVFVVFCCLVVVLCACMHTHTSYLSFDDEVSQSGQFAVPVNPRLEGYSRLVDSLMKYRLLEGY